jgi:hypothetical protein
MRGQQITVKHQDLPDVDGRGADSTAGHLYQDLTQRKANNTPVQILYDQNDPTQCVVKEAAPIGAKMNVGCLKGMLYPAILIDCLTAAVPAMTEDSFPVAAISVIIVAVAFCVTIRKKEQVKAKFDIRKIFGTGIKTVAVQDAAALRGV